jgi:hypothetical protein
MRGFLFSSLLLAAVSLAAFADGVPVRGPVSGFVLDTRSHSIRPINGLPGAAMLGDALPLPFAVKAAAISTALDFALVTSQDSDVVQLVTGLGAGAPATAALAGAIPASEIVLNSAATAAVLYSKSAAQLQVVTGLPAKPRFGLPLSVANWKVTAMAVDPTGRVAIVTDGASQNVYRLSLDRSGSERTAWIANVPGAASAAFLWNGRDAVVGSSSDGGIVLINDAVNTATISSLATAGQGIQSAVALRALSDHELCVADGQSGTLAVLDLSTVSTTRIPLAGSATRCEPLASGVYLLNEATQSPLLLLDTNSGRRTSFVPLN